MAAIPKPTGLEHLTGDGLYLQRPQQKDIFNESDPLSANVVDNREKRFTMLDSILSSNGLPLPIPFTDDWTTRITNRGFANPGNESNPLLDQLMEAYRSGSLERDAGIFAAAKSRSPYWPKK